MTLELSHPLENVICKVDATGTGLKEILLSPPGVIKTVKGTIIVDTFAAKMVIQEFDKHGVSVPIDFEHTTTRSPDICPAAGWIEKVYFNEKRGLLGLVRWNAKAIMLIRNDEYRYLSPVFWVSVIDRRVMSLHSAALTNKPAIPHMERVSASTNTLIKDKSMTVNTTNETFLTATTVALAEHDEGTGGDENNKVKTGDDSAMGLVRKIAIALGIKGDFKTTDVLKAVLKKISDASDEGQSNESDDSGEDQKVAASVRELLGLQSDAKATEIILAMKAHDTSSASVELVALKLAEAERVADELVQGYIDRAIINPADKLQLKSARELAMTDPDRLVALMENCSPFVEQGKTSAPPRPESNSRLQIIANATKGYGEDEQMQKFCSVDAAVNLALSEAGMSELGGDEQRELVRA